MKTNATRAKKSLLNHAVRTDIKPVLGTVHRSFTSDPPSMAEPTLQDMLGDPILQRLMDSDGVELRQLLALMSETRTRLLS